MKGGLVMNPKTQGEVEAARRINATTSILLHVQRALVAQAYQNWLPRAMEHNFD